MKTNTTIYSILTLGMIWATWNAVEKMKIPTQSFIFTPGSIAGMDALIIFTIWSFITLRWIMIKREFIKNLYLRYILIIALVIFLDYFLIKIISNFAQ